MKKIVRVNLWAAAAARSWMYDRGLAPAFKWGQDTVRGYAISRLHPYLNDIVVGERQVAMDGYWIPEDRLLGLFEAVTNAGHRARL